jgi:fluoroacetyl-CoA thioesterase
VGDVPIEPGLRGSTDVRVTEADTADALGSGDVPVLGTPRLLALAETATVDALSKVLESGLTSVGTRVQLEHLRPTAVGARVTVQAVLVATDGRLLHFDVVARDGEGTLIGRGQVTRVVVDRQRFLARL